MANRVFIIAEAGSNWRMGTSSRDLKMAETLIDVAADAGADAIKFQTYRAETVYVEGAGKSDYLTEAGINESINEIFRDLSMPYEMIPHLYDYCQKKKITFMSTPFSIKDAEAIDPFVKVHKIASYEITHSNLIRYIAKSGKPLILSTGAATNQDIEWAVNFFRENGGKDLTLMQTTAKYPAPLSTLNLSVIPSLGKMFGTPVGLSDHSRDPVIAPVCAVALGAKVIEKHFTLHNRLPGPDHSFAITPGELRIMVDAIRSCEEALGDGEKRVLEEEQELRRYAQRSIQVTKEIQKGDTFRGGINIDILRPGKKTKGLHPKYLAEIEGKKAKRDMQIGEGVMQDDFE